MARARALSAGNSDIWDSNAVMFTAPNKIDRMKRKMLKRQKNSVQGFFRSTHYQYVSVENINIW